MSRSLRDRRNSLEMQLEELYLDYGDGRVSKEEFEEKQSRLTAELNSLPEEDYEEEYNEER